jgi:hypothetical protein
MITSGDLISEMPGQEMPMEEMQMDGMEMPMEGFQQ